MIMMTKIRLDQHNYNLHKTSLSHDYDGFLSPTIAASDS